MNLFSFIITLDDERNTVLRQIIVEGQLSLFDFHQKIVKAFELDPGEMASFYHVEGEWETTEEIPMEPFDEKSGQRSMMNTTVEDVFHNHQRMVYVYDFLYLWTFFVEKVKLADDISTPGVVVSVGTLPQNAPDKSFETLEFPEDEDVDPEDDDYSIY
ncbi:MAG: hypothetical protein JJU02_07810 [Cryomorphaceae bacterium]|nr:hypothetical protein [Cryomorphaceae bacterium]